MSEKPKRLVLTTLQMLKVAMRYVRCPSCGEIIGTLANCQWDHIHQLALDGGNELENFSPKHIDCHAAKSRADAHARKKVRHRIKNADRYKPKAPAHEDATPAPLEAKPRRKATIPSRGFQKGVKTRLQGRKFAKPKEKKA